MLKKSVPVECCTLFRAGDVVVQSYLDGVTPIGFDHWAGESFIDQKDFALVSIRGNDAAANSEVVISYDTCIGIGSVIIGVVVEGAPWKAVGSWILSEKGREEWGSQGSQDR